MKSLMTLALLIGKLASSSAFTPASRSSLPLVRSFASAATLKMSKRVLVPIADDSEEIETTCITDTLTRFGADVVVASVKPGGDLVCKMSRGVKVR